MKRVIWLLADSKIGTRRWRHRCLLVEHCVRWISVLLCIYFNQVLGRKLETLIGAPEEPVYHTYSFI